MHAIKDFLIALAAGFVGSGVGHLVQYLSGGSVWLPNGDNGFAFWCAAYWFSRNPIWTRR
jgi:hypothetical protein